MVNPNTSRSLFLKKSKSKSPVTLVNLSPTKTTTFFNSNLGSRIEERRNITFKCESNTTQCIQTIITNQPTGMFDLIGPLKWSAPMREVAIGPQKSYKKK